MPVDLVEVKKLVGKTVGKYTIQKYLGSGGYGDVYKVTNEKGRVYALKIPVQKETKDGQASILTECRVYKCISDRDMGIIKAKAVDIGGRKGMVMDLLGPSVSKYFQKGTLGLKTVLLITIQMIDTLHHIHNLGYIHRDVKIQNLAVGRHDPNKIYCIDFGMTWKYTDKHGNHFIEKKSGFCGTETYASIAAMEGRTQCRRDDLESLCYTIIHLFKGSLPWQGIRSNDKGARIAAIVNTKRNVAASDLCSGMPEEFTILVKYIRNLDYYDKPHYVTLKDLMVNVYRNKFKEDYTEGKMCWVGGARAVSAGG